MNKAFLIAALLSATTIVGSAPAAAQVMMTEQQVRFYTADWKGERFADGRPKVSDDLVKRARDISLEEAWGTLRGLGYNNQFESRWQSLHEGKWFAGRALTAQYMPARPDMGKALGDHAKVLKKTGAPNIWPINELQPGDVYVADGYGKVADGTLIGDILGNSIYAKSKNGFVFDGSVRDVQGLSQIEGMNGFFREADPSYIQEMQMVQINQPIRIGRATVLPGDIVIAKFGGVVFIPAHLAETVITQSEFIALKDGFSHQAVRSGQFGPADMDVSEWAPKVRQAFLEWVKQNPGRVPMTDAQFQEVLKRNKF
ncbi:MAG TPA: RraA family protein [Sphingomicrobium sp.]|jgi:regulator of RNase E activity RraA